jgi:hypothetical protein
MRWCWTLNPNTGKLAVRGIFSLSQIGLLLGLDIDPAAPPNRLMQILKQAGY